jgi:hypothetical protein
MVFLLKNLERDYHNFNAAKKFTLSIDTGSGNSSSDSHDVVVVSIADDAGNSFCNQNMPVCDG